MTAIAPAQIQSELLRLWDAQKAINKNRASLFNLIFFAKKNARIEYVHSLVHKVIDKFPSRVLFITQTDQGNDLTTRVSVIPGSSPEADFACDLIEIEASGSSLERIPFLLLPHLVPDLPIITIWADEPAPGNPLFEQLIALSGRMIFDSGVAKDLPKFAKALLAVNKKCSIADLTWARFENWRKLLSATFYTPERLEQLYRTNKLHIFYNSESKPVLEKADLQALFLQKWLEAELRWKAGSVEVVLTPESQPQLTPGSILSLDLSTSDNCHFSFGRDLHFPNQICMRFSTLVRCDIPLKYIFPKTETGRALVKEIGHQGTSPHFLHLLESLHAL